MKVIRNLFCFLFLLAVSTRPSLAHVLEVENLFYSGEIIHFTLITRDPSTKKLVKTEVETSRTRLDHAIQTTLDILFFSQYTLTRMSEDLPRIQRACLTRSKKSTVPVDQTEQVASHALEERYYPASLLKRQTGQASVGMKRLMSIKIDLGFCASQMEEVVSDFQFFVKCAQRNVDLTLDIPLLTGMLKRYSMWGAADQDKGMLARTVQGSGISSPLIQDAVFMQANQKAQILSRIWGEAIFPLDPTVVQPEESFVTIRIPSLEDVQCCTVTMSRPSTLKSVGGTRQAAIAAYRQQQAQERAAREQSLASSCTAVETIPAPSIPSACTGTSAVVDHHRDQAEDCAAEELTVEQLTVEQDDTQVDEEEDEAGCRYRVAPQQATTQKKDLRKGHQRKRGFNPRLQESPTERCSTGRSTVTTAGTLPTASGDSSASSDEPLFVRVGKGDRDTFAKLADSSYQQGVEIRAYERLLVNFITLNTGPRKLLKSVKSQRGQESHHLTGAAAQTTQSHELDLSNGATLLCTTNTGLRVMLGYHLPHGHDGNQSRFIPKEYRAEYFKIFQELGIQLEDLREERSSLRDI